MQNRDELTRGERAVRCLIGEPIDRVPFGVGIGWWPWGETLERWRKETGNRDLQPSTHLGYDGSFACPELAYGCFPPFERVVIREEGEHVVFRDYRGITMRGRKDGHSMPEFLDHPVKKRDDWERLKTERLKVTDPSRVLQEWDPFIERLRRTGEAVQVGGFPWGVFGTVRDLMGTEETLVAFYDEPQLVHDVMDHLTDIWLALYERVAARVRIDHIHVWEDMSGRQGSLISPAMVEDFMMPCYDRIVRFARSHDVRLVSVDTDGNCEELVPLFMSHGVNMLLPFEVQAGNDVREYRRRYPTLGIEGGLDKRALSCDREAIDREVDRAEEALRDGRYIPGFDHLIPPDVPWSLMEYAAERLRTLCSSAGCHA